MTSRNKWLYAVSFCFVGCLDQYNPRNFWATIKQERQVAHRVLPKLENGMLPKTGDAAVVVKKTAAESYQALCAACHGEKGDGKTPMAAALNPPPRNFLDQAWLATVTKEKTFQVIKNGGASVGLSGTMAPWGGLLSDEEIHEMVELVLNFK